MTILIIIQQLAIRQRAAAKLEAAGHEVLQSDNSVNAVALLKAHPINLIITETNIGDVDGWRLSRLIRSGVFPCGANAPIVLMTENHNERIAETTARLFDINRVMSFQDIDLVADVVQLVSSNQGNLNNPHSVLVIEDTRDTAELVKRMLKQNFEVDIALDGEEGLAIYRNKSYDIILLDVMMPGLSGEEVLEEILKLNPKQVVIMMTAHGNMDLAELMLVKGASDYIQKPFKADQLRKVCDIAAKREDFLISSAQFAAKVDALNTEQEKYDSLSKTHYRVLDSLSSVVVEINLQGRITFLNDAWYQCTEYTVSETLGSQFIDFIHDSSKQSQSYIEEAYRDLLSGKSLKDNTELKLNRKTGEPVWCEINLSPYYNSQGNLAGVAGTIDNIGVRKRAEERLKHVALHDTLTGLYNRYFFENELKKLSKQVSRSQAEHALLYLDLDHFKVINDSQGHHQGDLVLKEVAKLLEERCRDSDMLCRIGGDEFVFLLIDTDVAQADIMARSVCETIATTSFQFDEQVYKISCSIGITSINKDNNSPDLCLQQADIAMFAAKHRGRNGTHIFTENDKLTDELKQGFEWAQKVQKAIVEDNLEIHFQPIIEIKTGHIECYEALVRLVVDDNMIYPGEFIPSLEKAEDMILLDRHVIGKVFKLISQHDILNKVAINLSAQAFSDESLLPYIEGKLAQYQIDPSQVIFELTESDSISNLTGTERIINALNTLGCGFSIDDFGTGFSTFTYLKRLPADSVKIDGSFVVDMLSDPIDAALVKAIHEAALALDKKTVAEFVENQQTLDELAKLGVHYAQGFHIGKPKDVFALKALELANETGNVA